MGKASRRYKPIKKRRRIILCPGCGVPQKLGSDCGICATPLYKPYLIEKDDKLVLRTYKELEDATSQEETCQKEENS